MRLGVWTQVGVDYILGSTSLETEDGEHRTNMEEHNSTKSDNFLSSPSVHLKTATKVPHVALLHPAVVLEAIMDYAAGKRRKSWNEK